MYEICICLLDGTGATVTGDRECSVSSYSRTGFVRTPRDGFGWAGYCRHHSATQEIGRIYEICILDGRAEACRVDIECRYDWLFCARGVCASRSRDVWARICCNYWAYS